MIPDKKRKAYVMKGFIDMRKQINGLAKIVQDAMPDGSFSGSYFMFMGKTRRTMKILYWDRSGFCLWQKRLEEERFPWPAAGEGLTPVVHYMLLLALEGADPWKAHRKLSYTYVA